MNTRIDTDTNPLALAADRESAADDLETAIAQLGKAYRRYQQLTHALSEHVGPHLGRRLEVPFILHLRAAGLGPYLERKLDGAPGSLRAVCESEHSRQGR